MSEETTTKSTATLPPPNNASAAEEIGRRADTIWTRGEGAAPAIAKVASRSVRGEGGRVAILAGWGLSRRATVSELAIADGAVYKSWRFLVRYLVPAVIIALFLANLGS